MTLIRRIHFLPLLVFAVFCADCTATAQTVMEAVDSVSLYGEVGPEGRVPVVTCIDLDSSGRLLAIGGDDHQIRLWDVSTKQILLTLQGHLDWVRGLAFSSDRSRLATIGQDGQIKLWNTADGSLVQTFEEPVRGSRNVVFEPNGTRFAVCGFGSNVRMYDGTGNVSATLVATLPTHGGNNSAIAYSPDGSRLAVAGRTGVVRIWSTSDNRHLVDIRTDGRRVNAVAFSPDGTLLAFAGDGPFIILARLDGTIAKRLPERPGKTYALTFCGPNLLASGESDNAVRLWNLTENKETATFLGHTGTISTMMFEPTTRRLITGSFDTTVKFWSVPETF